MGGRWHKNQGGKIRIGGRGTKRECYKSGEAPMVKIKDFTLASKNLGSGACVPEPYTPPVHEYNSRICVIQV